ncbi:MAG: hypothetical protein ABEH40_01435 [Haloferacaceae archaeon]
MSASTSPSTYRPGYCNIGRRQRYRRLAAGLGTAVLGAAYVAACLAGPVPRVLLPGVFVPLAISFEYLFQAHGSFCVVLALAGRYDFTDRDGSGPAGEVAAPSDRRADRLRAAKLSAAAVGLAAVVTLAIVVAA